jgi:D-lactate dehydrogenase (cytochrome)
MPRLFAGKELAGMEKYFMDESKRSGHADALVFPRSTDEVAAAVAVAREHEWAVTVSGARTGIAAGAVPEGGLVVSLERMNEILGVSRRADGTFIVRCQGGMRLQDLQKALKNAEFANASNWSDKERGVIDELRRDRHFFPPDPTETSASIGGIAACNASGAHTFRYGPARPYIESVTVVLTDGSVVRVTRGIEVADAEGAFVLVRSDGKEICFHVPTYSQPATKNAAGYYSGERLDAVDLFVGSEGTLGIITEVEVRLVPVPETNSAAVLFLPDESAALCLTRMLREAREALGIEAIEYFDGGALAFMRRHRAAVGAASGVPECLPEDAGTALYLDIGIESERLPEVIERVIEFGVDAGAVPERCWSADEADERERLRLFRHALPEAVNGHIASLRRRHAALTKLGTDMAVPDECLEEVMAMYRKTLDAAGLNYVVFGHIGNNHVHVNILPENSDEYEAGKELYLQFARRVVDMGGSPVAEHGIGKLKREFLKILIGEKGLDEMRSVKAAFDPEFRLGKGTLFG